MIKRFFLRKTNRLTLVLGLGLATGFAGFQNVWAEPPPTDAPGAPTGLLVDLHPRPLAVEDLIGPRFSWIVQDPRRGAIQTAHQILVATDPERLTAGEADVWDSGRIETSANAAVAYAGPPLEPATRYYWTVRTWDKNDQAGPFAEPAVLGTGLHDTWIAEPIWAADPDDPWLNWQDYTISFDATIHENAATVWFRAADADNNYMWQLRSGPNELARHVFQGGSFVLEVVPLPFNLQTETTYRVSIEAIGNTIRTFIDGELIDQTEDNSFDRGTVGFRHGNFEQATYANLEVLSTDGVVLLHSDLIAENPFPCGSLTADGLRLGRGERCLFSPSSEDSDPDDFPRSGNDWALLRTDFEVPAEPIAYATLYATGLSPEPAAQHVYRAELNGEFVGIGPARGYDGMNLYNAFDVTDRLLSGANTLAFVAYAASGQAVQAQLNIVYVNGDRQIIATNTDDWEARSGSDLYLDVGNAGHDSYYYAPREYLRADRWPHGFSSPGFDSSNWNAPVAKPSIEGLTGMPTRNLERETREPVTVNEIGPGAYRLDFGRTVVGGLRINVNGSQGDEVDIRLGEELNSNGTVRYQMRTGNHYRDRWTLAEGEQTLEHFGYRVFRYAEVHGLPEGAAAESIVGIGLIYPFDDEAAAFSSSDPHLDEVWDFSRDSIRLLSMDLYMDTPSRERRAYEGDSYLHQLAHYALDREFALARYSTEYLYFNYTWPTEWKLTSPSAAWRDYLQTGDDRSLERYYELLRDTKSVRHFMDHRGLVVKSPGGAHHPDAWTDLIDWPAGLRDGYVFTDVNTVINAYNERSVRDLGRIAKTLGRPDEAEELTGLADTAADAINSHLFDPETGLYRDGLDVDHHALHASIFPLAFGIATDREAVAAQALADRRIVGNIFSAAYQVEALFALRRAEDALDLLTSDDLKSWRNMIAIGAGTTMETWDPSLKNNTTYSHPAGASPVYLIPRGVFGIEILEPAHRRFTVKPQPGGLEQAEIRVPTLSGTIEAAFETDDDRLRFDLNVPANTTAELRLPGDAWWHVRESEVPVREAEGVRIIDVDGGFITLEVRAGVYSFTVDPAAEAPVVRAFGDHPIDLPLMALTWGDPSGLQFVVSSAENGTVMLLSDGTTARFIPDGGFTGPASFQVTATGGNEPRQFTVHLHILAPAEPRIAQINGGGFQLDFLTEQGRAYLIEKSQDLHSWSELKTVEGDGNRLPASLPKENGDTARFFRIKALP